MNVVPEEERDRYHNLSSMGMVLLGFPRQAIGVNGKNSVSKL